MALPKKYRLVEEHPEGYVFTFCREGCGIFRQDSDKCPMCGSANVGRNDISRLKEGIVEQ